MDRSGEGLLSAVRRSPLWRLILVGFLALVLQVPVAQIGGLVSERQQRRDSAVEEVSSKWGARQFLTGPALVLRYTERWTETGPNGRPIARTQTRRAVFLPDQLKVQGKVATSLRHRGIFSVPVYRASLTLSGEFARPDLAELGINPATVDWRRAHLALGIADARAVAEQAAVVWNGRRVGFLPGTGEFNEVGAGIHAPVGGDANAGRVAFSFPLEINGSSGLSFVPFGRETVVDLESNWPSPSFQGNWLPTERETSSQGFTAHWSIPFLGRNYPQAWISQGDMRDRIATSQFGVDLLDPVDEYRMAERSVKYAVLFILLTFSAMWLIEVLAGLRVHPIQYLLLGAALCLFYLLELSLSEHLGFTVAYAVAVVAVVAMVGAYSLSALRSAPKAALVTAGVAMLYGYLHILLRNEDYALLIGSIGLFAILAAVMFVTRRVDWYALDARGPASEGQSAR